MRISHLSFSNDARYQGVFDYLAEGDSSLYTALRSSLNDVPATIAVGDLFVATWAKQVIWYEVLELVLQTHVLVRLYSRTFKQGEYDVISLDLLEAGVTRGLFERARAHGFRTVRQSN